MRERVRARACPAYASVSPRERVFSRPPEEGEVSHPISGIGLGVMPVRPHTPRRSVLTSSRWTDPNPSSSAMGAAPHHVESEAVIPMAWRTPAGGRDPSVRRLPSRGLRHNDTNARKRYGGERARMRRFMDSGSLAWVGQGRSSATPVPPWPNSRT